MKICVVGNSHVAALRHGWAQIKQEYEPIELVFFASPQQDMNTLRLADGVLTTTLPRAQKNMAFTSGGLSEIRISDYDAFVISLNAGVKSLMSVLRAHRPVEVTTSARHLVSDSFTKAVIESSWRRNPAVILAETIRSQSDRPILILETPLPTDAILSTKSAKYWEPAADLIPYLRSGLEPHAASLRQSASIDYLPQPDDTIEAGMTKRRYGDGSVRLTRAQEEHHEEEPHHMNAEYGAIILRQAFQSSAVMQPG